MNYVAWVLKIAGKQGRERISWFGQGEGGGVDNASYE